MSDENTHSSIFISYAWGGGLEKKEWVRESIVAALEWQYAVFWDRDSIGFGESIDTAIGLALSERPILVLCLCDEDYLEAAQRIGSGLHRELQILQRIADEPSVRIVPLMFGERCAEHLPKPLAGRLYLDLQPLLQHGLDLGAALLDVVDGVSQAQVQKRIAADVARHQLRKRVLSYLQKQPLTLWGNGRTHEVTVCSDDKRPYLLLAPQWMWDSNEWGFMLSDDNPTFCPTKGRWHWDRFSPSRGMRALGTAALSVFFPHWLGEVAQSALNAGGVVLAEKFFTQVDVMEAFTFNVDDLVTSLIVDYKGYGVLEQLLEAVDTGPVNQVLS
ncbi:toll/interleukin-1 receptor domain-containing protein [Pseudomonas sp. P105]|uniref:toll/interleukin-1 receptor domain-containing protein n=1 Tax=Pseudomonas sp. P105 TaxID=3049542 RepID=UPI002934527B|nr:toll/interleukin-1 receptor domain-containing protein [Pseudomonas sp. P105]WNZ76423.1 toll/interleukin-1 receptor domain-containing protein [Pseudomonas sp. P105]